jgi:hypothetical protein
MLLGHPPHRMAKALWDNSMAEKRCVSEHARPAAPRDLHDMAKAGLLEPQSPEMESHIPRHGVSGRGRQDKAVSLSLLETSSCRATVNETVQGDEQGAYVVLGRSTRRDTGSPAGREAYGDGAVVVVRGRESRPHGEGPQVLDGRMQR